MSPLLSLPQELRDIIIKYSITHHDIAALDGGASHRKGRVELNDIEYFSRLQSHGVLWAPTVPSTDPIPLLLTCKQLHRDTLEVRRHITHTKVELDILLVNEDELWPTWTFVPPAPNIHGMALNVTVRMSGIATEGRSGFEEAPPQGLRSIWRFSSILERILRCGWGAPKSVNVDEAMSLARLDVNFITPSLDPVNILPESIAPHYACGERAANEMLKDAYLSPHALATTLANWVAVAIIHRDMEIEFMGSEHDLAELLGRIANDIKFYADGKDVP
ncbi:hypothetical protein BT63DRAFT_426046 [Microthyrium microscopicum]|uniref:Uncharacterized protein n=1 Tax=Microthyrium microscopicum TaxID=703497 RepID=A0A6A6UCE5_9PEZI|nr:hypothetical protein BT63DRAFT_426046 [Microthyrium microscopicum]